MPTEFSVVGSILSRGVVIGTPYFLDRAIREIPNIDLQSVHAVEEEVHRYKKAIRESHRYLVQLKNRAQKEGGEEIIALLESHLQIIEDPLLNYEIEQEIRLLSKNAEFVLNKTVAGFEKKFHAMNDAFFQQRIVDIQDISERILDCLQEKKNTSFDMLPKDSIIFAHVITPSDAADARRKNVVGFVTERGSNLSHTAIVAKARGIPYISGIDFSKLSRILNAERVIVDALLGKIICNPSQKTQYEYRQLQEQIQQRYKLLQKPLDLPCQTIEGDPIALYISIDGLDDLTDLKTCGAAGIGLFRTEYLVLQGGRFPTEEEQFEIYKQLVCEMKTPVVIRCFDLGLDKVPVGLDPLSGYNGIRFLLEERTLFFSQLRAMLRASSFGNLQILLPMISSLQELVASKKLLQEAKEQLIFEGHIIPDSPRLGCMVELPSAAMMSSALAKECDFFSIGTNDLMQYSLAIDRLNQSSHTGASIHPGFLRLLQMIIEEGRKAGIPVYICGEMASDPQLIALLIGLGAKGFSVPLRIFPLIKDIIRLTSTKKGECLANELLRILPEEAGLQLLDAYCKECIPESVRYEYTAS